MRATPSPPPLIMTAKDFDRACNLARRLTNEELDRLLERSKEKPETEG